MPSLQALRRKIGGVKNTQKITKAMKMVAAAKLRRAQERALSARPYADRMSEIFHRVSGRVDRTIHPLLADRPIRRVELLVITSDRGLCGGFNASVQMPRTNASINNWPKYFIFPSRRLLSRCITTLSFARRVGLCNY